jgi:hypothetical protein
MAAATIKQVGRLASELAADPKTSQMHRRNLLSTDQGLAYVASAIESGRFDDAQLEFLTWLQRPKTDLDALSAAPAASAEPTSSGSRMSEGESGIL